MKRASQCCGSGCPGAGCSPSPAAPPAKHSQPPAESSACTDNLRFLKPESLFWQPLLTLDSALCFICPTRAQQLCEASHLQSKRNVLRSPDAEECLIKRHSTLLHFCSLQTTQVFALSGRKMMWPRVSIGPGPAACLWHSSHTAGRVRAKPWQTLYHRDV